MVSAALGAITLMQHALVTFVINMILNCYHIDIIIVS